MIRFQLTRLTVFAMLLVAGRCVHADDDGFLPLFDGKTLEGWVQVNCAPSTFSVRNGKIYCTGKPTGVIRTERMYQNFVLELEWRHLQPKGNAGLFVWSDPLTSRGVPFTRSIEVQVLDGIEGPGYTSQGDIFPIHGASMVPDNGRGGARAFPTEDRSKPSPEWNHYEVTCMDGIIRLAVNGKVVTSGSQCSPRKGYICLESEGSPIEFRNLRIKELPDDQIPDQYVAREAEGFVSLYNGADLSGWKAYEGLVGHWKPSDWRLEYDGQSTGEVKDLWTEDDFEDFTLIVDWRWKGKDERTKRRSPILPSGDYAKNDDGTLKEIDVPVADSGIYLRGSTKAQINIWQWPVGSGEIWGYRTDASMPAEVRAGATPNVNADRPVGEWNRFEITMCGEDITVILNGQTVIDHCQLPGVPLSGPIALQHHGDPIEFANIYLKRR